MSDKKTEIEELKEKTGQSKATAKTNKLNPYDAVIRDVEKTTVKRGKCYACIRKDLPRAYISLGDHTVTAYSAKLVDTGTGWMELSAPTPGAFIRLTDAQAEEFVESVKDRQVVWADPQKQRCSIYSNASSHKSPGHSVEPLAKYIVFETAKDMTAEMVLSPEDIPTLYEKAENELSKT